MKPNSIIDLVQNNFLLFIYFKFNIHGFLRGSYKPILKCTNLCTFKQRRIILLSKQLHNLLISDIDCPQQG